MMVAKFSAQNTKYTQQKERDAILFLMNTQNIYKCMLDEYIYYRILLIQLPYDLKQIQDKTAERK